MICPLKKLGTPGVSLPDIPNPAHRGLRQPAKIRPVQGLVNHTTHIDPPCSSQDGILP